jgi:hypothetical protein
MGAYLFRPTRWRFAAALSLVLIVGGLIAYDSNQAQAGADQARLDPVCLARASSPQSQGTNSGGMNVIRLPPGQILGAPSIHPRPELASRPGAHFTETDVRQYLAAHPEQLGGVPGTPAPTIICVRFLSAAAMHTLLHVDVGVSYDTLLCVVRLSGTFLPWSLPLGARLPSPVHRASMIFDAQTGNLLTESLG